MNECNHSQVAYFNFLFLFWCIHLVDKTHHRLEIQQIGNIFLFNNRIEKSIVDFSYWLSVTFFDFQCMSNKPFFFSGLKTHQTVFEIKQIMFFFFFILYFQIYSNKFWHLGIASRFSAYHALNKDVFAGSWKSLNSRT